METILYKYCYSISSQYKKRLDKIKIKLPHKKYKTKRIPQVYSDWYYLVYRESVIYNQILFYL